MKFTHLCYMYDCMHDEITKIVLKEKIVKKKLNYEKFKYGRRHTPVFDRHMLVCDN